MKTARKKMAKTPPKPKRTQAEPTRPENASREANLIPMGRLGAARGLSGWLEVVSYADPPEQLQQYRNWTLAVNGRHKQVTLRRLRSTGKGLECHIEDIETREAAEALNGAEIHVPREPRCRLPERMSGTGPTSRVWKSVTLRVCAWAT